MFEIFIRPELYARISYLFRKTDSEVGALLECYNEGERFVVEDMYITKQIVSGSTVDFDEDAVSMLLLDCMETNKEITGWLHSHHTMKSFWSGTDDNTIAVLNEHIGGWVLSIVGNKKMELVGRIDYVSTTPFGVMTTRVNDVPINTLPEISAEDMLAVDNAVALNVSKKVTPIYGSQYGPRYNNKYGSVNTDVVGAKKVVQKGGTKFQKSKIKTSAMIDGVEVPYMDMTEEELDACFINNLDGYYAVPKTTRLGSMTDDEWVKYYEEN